MTGVGDDPERQLMERDKRIAAIRMHYRRLQLPTDVGRSVRANERQVSTEAAAQADRSYDRQRAPDW